MNVLIFPEYAYPSHHVVVNTVYESLLPARGHGVHMIRPMAEVSQPQVAEASWTGGSLVGYPGEGAAGPHSNAFALVRRWRWLRRAVRKFDGIPLDVVLVRNDLPSALAAMSLARTRRIPFVYQLSSPDAEFRGRLGRRIGGLRGGYQRVRGRIDMALRRRVMRNASVVLAISDAMRDYLVGLDTLDARRVFSFPMGVRDFEPPLPAVTDALRHDLGLQRGHTIVYSGVIDPARESAWMLDILDRVRTQLPKTVLMVLTYQKPDDGRRRAFEAEARRRGAPVTVVGPLSHREVDAYLRCADVMLSPIPPGPEYTISSPTKSIEGMCAGLPIVGNVEVAEHEMLFQQSGGGIAVRWDKDAFADAIVSLLRNPDEALAMGARGRGWVLRHRTYAHLTEYLELILQRAGSVTALGELPHQVEQRGGA